VNEIRVVQWNLVTSEIDRLDQTLLPNQTLNCTCRSVDRLTDALARLLVRGAPVLGASGALGVALAMLEGEHQGWSVDTLNQRVDAIGNARPTAVNLAWGVDHALGLHGPGHYPGGTR
jgi:methylthioribose-1-phosphate isomerase